MSDLKRYVNTRKKRDKKFAQGYDEGYERFRVGAIRKTPLIPLILSETISVLPIRGWACIFRR